MSGNAEIGLPIIQSACPAATAGYASATPLYGICVIGTPAITVMSSAPMCTMLPMPAEAKLTPPGFVFPSAMSSLTLAAGRDGVSMTI